MRSPRLTRLAEVLVNYSVGVRLGQLVRISGGPLATGPTTATAMAAATAPAREPQLAAGEPAYAADEGRGAFAFSPAEPLRPEMRLPLRRPEATI